MIRKIIALTAIGVTFIPLTANAVATPTVEQAKEFSSLVYRDIQNRRNAPQGDQNEIFDLGTVAQEFEQSLRYAPKHPQYFKIWADTAVKGKLICSLMISEPQKAQSVALSWHQERYIFKMNERENKRRIESIMRIAKSGGCSVF